MKRPYPVVIASIILITFAVIALSGMRYNSPAYDEVSHHIGNGYSFLKTGDFRLNSTQPPLIEELAALPLLFLSPVLPLDHSSWVNIERDPFGFQFLYRYNSDANRIVFWARVPIVMLSVLCGILVFIWARELYGEKAGVFALFLYAFSPNVLAYSQIVTADLGVTFFILLAMYRFYKFLKKPKLKNILLAGIALGLAQAAKVTALILIPLFFIIVLYRWLKMKDRRYIIGLGSIYALCVMVIFASYFGEIKPLLKNDVDVPEKIEYISKAANILFPGNEAIKKKLVDFALNRPIPFATYIMNILSSTNLIFREEIFKVFLAGKWSTTGWWYFYPAVFLFKTPLVTLILIIIVLLNFKALRPRNRLSEAMLISFPLLFIIISLCSKLQGGVRYILPLYPFIFIYVSKIVNLKIGKRIVFNSLIFLLCFWYLTGTIRTYPYYISYFNRIAGGAENGWRYLRDSNIDYGQGLISLADYLKRNNIDRVKLSYSGTADTAYYGIKAEGVDKKDFLRPQQAVYAISVNNIDSFKWTKTLKPTAKAAYSIFIYDLRGDKDPNRWNRS